MSLKTNLFRFIFISVLGVLLHFTYEWSGDNAVVGLFSAVNESTWEHLKLLFFPVSASDHPRSAAPQQYVSGTVSPGKSSRYPRRNGRDCGRILYAAGCAWPKLRCFKYRFVFCRGSSVIVCRKQTVSQVFSSVDESRSRCPAVAYGCIFRVHLLPAGYWIVLGSYSRPLMV